MLENFKAEKPIKSAAERVELVGDLDEETFKQIVASENAAFNKNMRFKPEDIAEVLADKRGVHLVMRDPENKIIGYVSTLPHNEEYGNLVQYDPDFTKEDDALYIESFGSGPAGRDPHLSVAAFDRLIEEAGQKGYKKLTMHARVSNGFSRGLQKLYGAKFIRRVENWGDFGEPFDYLEIDIEKETPE